MGANTNKTLPEILLDLKSKRDELKLELSNYNTELSEDHHAFKKLEFGENKKTKELFDYLNDLILEFDQTEFDLTFSANGGTFTTLPEVMKGRENEELTVPNPNPTTITPPEGKLFQGWHPSATGLPADKGISAAPIPGFAEGNKFIMPDSNITLYAWYGMAPPSVEEEEQPSE